MASFRSGLLLLVGFLSFATLASAQPPGINNSRWMGGTALAQPQGFSQGSPITLTWGFMDDGSIISNDGFGAASGSNLIAEMNNIYGSQAVWQPLFQSVFDRWAAVSGLSFQFEANDDGAALNGNNPGLNGGVLGTRADLRIGGRPLPGSALAYNYFPADGGDMVIDLPNAFYSNTAGNSLLLRNVVSHEHGHGMGQSHVQTNNAAFLMQPFIQDSFDGPQFNDILLAQRAYGDVFEKSFAGLGNDVVTRATPLGLVPNGGDVSIGNSARATNLAELAIAPTDVDFISIDDNTDTDFLSFTVTASGTVDILLEPLGFTYNVTNQGGNGDVAFDPRLRSNLTLQLRGTDGISVLGFANDTGFGGNEVLNGIFLPGAGTYFIRIQGTDNPDTISTDTQFYGLTIGFTASAVPEPGTLALLGGGVAGCASYWRYRRGNQRRRRFAARR